MSQSSGESRSGHSALSLFGRFYSHLSSARRKQVLFTVVLMLMGSAAELVTIGAFGPFVALMAQPEAATEVPWLERLLVWLGWTDVSSLLLPMSIVFVAIVTVATSIRLLLIFANNRLVFGVGHDFGVRLYSLMLRQPYEFHIARNTGDLIATVNKAQILVNSLLRPIIDGLSALILGIAILIALLLVDAATALGAGLAFVVIYVAIIQLFRLRLRRNSAIISGAQGARIRSVQEGLGGIRDVILDSSQTHYSAQFSEIDSQLRRAQATNALLAQAPRFLVEAVIVALIVALAYTLSRQEGGLLSALPTLGALALGAQRLLPLIQRVYQAWAQYSGNFHVMVDVLETLDLPAPDTAFQKATQLPFDREITINQMSFRYSSSDSDVLREIDVNVPKGSRVGIIGKTGSGKTTLMDIVMGLLTPQNGQILVDGIRVDERNQSAWQAHISHVPQQIYLADASITENIALGVPSNRIDEGRVARAASQARIAAFVESLSDGYNTRVGERGVRLSGGQRQRIGIARALYRKADFLVFDEASSALDVETELEVMRAVDELDPELTVLIIAHRVQTLRGCDLILKLERGRLIGVGSYEEMIGGAAPDNSGCE
ncbi:MAG: ABC transporter ATP-binding protein [Pseudomonadota bacterium]